jgi:hypothetical protein
MKALEFIDFLGKKPTLLIAKQASHKSLLGGVLSLLTLVGLLAGIGYFASILFARKTFNVVGNQQLNLTQSMNLSDYPIAVNIADQFGRHLEDEERLFGVALVWYSFRSIFNPLTNSTVMTPFIEQIPLEKCNMKINKFDKFKKILEKEPDLHGYCIPQGLNITLMSPVGYTTTSFMSFWFYRCQNITQLGKTDCLPPDVIEQRLSNFWLASFFIDYYFDHDNLLEPAQPYLRKEAIVSSSSPYLFRDMTLSMKNVDYSSDTNYLIANPEVLEYNALDAVKDTTTSLKENTFPNSFTSITFNMGSIKQIYNRKYYKLQNMLADLGGLMKALITITLNINLYFSNKTFFNKVIDANINSLYIKSIRKSLLTDVVGGEGKKRGTVFMDSQGKNRSCDQQDQESKTEKGQKEDDVTYDPKYYDQGKNDQDQGSPKKLMHNNKTFVSEIGYVSERVPVKDEMTIRSDARSARPTSNIELGKLSNGETAKGNQEEQLAVLPSSVQLKKNRNVVFNNFKINFCGYLFPGCCFKKGSQTSKQLELHSKFSDIINQHMDILNISKKLHTVDKINYVLCGDQYKNVLETTINPYLYDGAIPKSSDIYEAREDIITALKLSGK